MVDNIQTQPALVLLKIIHSNPLGLSAERRLFRVWAAILILIMTMTGCTPSYQGAELSGTAPDFQLTDQYGSLKNLSDFRGKVVVLTFMDSNCQDTCPLTAVHFRETYQQLNQDDAEQIAFLGVNVNVEANTVVDVLETTLVWRLDEIPSWHFLTGSRESLEPVWSDYGVSATQNPDGISIMHTPGVFLIDATGEKRWYISTPFFGDEDLTLPLSELLLKHIREILRESKD